jgi:hypothetical protein
MKFTYWETNCNKTVTQHSSFYTQVNNMTSHVLRHTSHLNAVSCHTLRIIYPSTLITAPRILSAVPSRIVAEDNTSCVLGVAPGMKIKDVRSRDRGETESVKR